MKTLKEFMNENTVTAFDVINDLILSAVVDQVSYGIDVDTSTIPGGMPVTTISDFSLDSDMLTVGDITIDISTTNMLGMNVNELHTS